MLRQKKIKQKSADDEESHNGPLTEKPLRPGTTTANEDETAQ